MTQLSREDLQWCLRLCPVKVLEALKANPNKLVVAGGFIRACISHEKPNDVDLFAPSKDYAEAAAKSMACNGRGIITTDNAFTVLGHRMPIQFIHRWVYESPQVVVPSFDFTIAQAAFWHDGKAWQSLCANRFYQDLAAKRLVYTQPVRNEDAGGSALRVLKFYQMGYRIPLDSMGAVIARLVWGVSQSAGGFRSEDQLAKILTGLLREVDPNVDPSHIAHLPSLDEPEEEASATPADSPALNTEPTP